MFRLSSIYINSDKHLERRSIMEISADKRKIWPGKRLFCCFSHTHRPHVLFPSFEGDGHVSVPPAVISDFVTLEELAELLNTAHTHRFSPHSMMTKSVISQEFRVSAVRFPPGPFN